MTSNFLKLISLNIEKDKHLKSVLDFLGKNDWDVVCLQEIFKRDFEFFKNKFSVSGVFAPMMILDNSDGERDDVGVAILSRLEIRENNSLYYVGDGQALRYWDSKALSLFCGNITEKDLETLDRISDKVFVFIKVFKGDVEYNIGTTHFTWTPNGKENSYQSRDIKKLLAFTKQIKSLILCGDFNVARGDSKIYEILSEEYKDNIPEKYDSSIDPNLHRVKGLKRMVDYIFSTPDYLVKNVELIEGVSDHKAVVGKVYKI